MQQNSNLDRTKSIERMAPDIYKYKTVLYIGACMVRMDYVKEFIDAGYEVTILEAWQENCDKLINVPGVKNVICGDIVYEEIENKYDVVFFWHGPEHIEIEKLPHVFKKLESLANKMVVMGCPNGVFDQGDIYNNPYERHVSHLDYIIFEKYGYDVECLGEGYGSNITAVKKGLGNA